MAMTEGAEQDADWENRERTLDEPESSGGAHRSIEFAIDRIRNPWVVL